MNLCWTKYTLRSKKYYIDIFPNLGGIIESDKKNYSHLYSCDVRHAFISVLP